MTPGGSPSGFRPDIQALRAVAVALVVVVHLTPGVLPGGFIGVDVFFVISGFLITGHLLREIETTGRIGVTAFWARRIRRLLPAATVVLAASLIAVIVFAPRSVWQRSAFEIVASALYVENWALAAASTDYLAGDDDPTVVQHFWSLGVEEQFYVVWPLLLLLAIALGRARTRRSLAIVLSIVFVASFSYSIVTTAADPLPAYFNTGARAWEFAAGGILALVPSTVMGGRLLAGRPAVVAGWLGYALILGAALTYDAGTPYPGAAALIPVVGAVLIIAARDAGDHWSASWPGRAAPVQWIGTLSYSIYLWHWPLIVLLPFVLGRHPGWKWDLVTVAATVLLAWLTYRFVEQPVRTGVWWRSRRRSFGLAAASMVLVVAAAGTTWATVGAQSEAAQASVQSRLADDPCFGARAMVESTCQDPFARDADLDTAFAAEDEYDVAIPCEVRDESVDFRVCRYGDVDNPSFTLALLGNSHASHLMPGLEEYAVEHGWEIVLITKRACLGVTETLLPSADDEARSCASWTAQVHDYLAGMPRLDAVLFAAHHNVVGYLSTGPVDDAGKEVLRAGMEKTFERLLGEGLAVGVIADTPSMTTQAPDCIDLSRDDVDPCAYDRPRRDDLVTEAAVRVDGVAIIDLSDYFCTADRCHALIGDVVVYSDGNHMTATFSRTLGPYLGRDVEAALRTG